MTISSSSFSDSGSRPILKTRSRPRIREADFSILRFGEQDRLLEKNYKKEFLKRICRHYRLPVSGNKNELEKRVHLHLEKSVYACIIQRTWRHCLLRSCILLRGPGFISPKKAVNDTDFYTMTECKDIPVKQFTSFHDDSGRVYIFDILSLATLFRKKGRSVVNPYNRQPFPTNTYSSLKRLIRISRALGHSVVTVPPPPPVETAEQKCISLFHDIYLLGHYPSPTWFTSLSRTQLVRYIEELKDIWQYRANLMTATQREICPPDGLPFRNMIPMDIHTQPLEQLQRYAVKIMSRMIRDGITEDSRKLGAFFVLTALTLVSTDAAASMPVLHAAALPMPP